MQVHLHRCPCGQTTRYPVIPAALFRPMGRKCMCLGEPLASQKASSEQRLHSITIRQQSQSFRLKRWRGRILMMLSCSAGTFDRSPYMYTVSVALTSPRGKVRGQPRAIHSTYAPFVRIRFLYCVRFSLKTRYTVAGYSHPCRCRIVKPSRRRNMAADR